MSDPLKRRAHDLVLRYGWNATALQVLGPGFQYWFGSAGDAMIAYVNAGGYRIVAGAPFCSEDRLPAVAAEFAQDALEDGRRVIFFACEQRLIHQLTGLSWDFLRIGLQACWDPLQWSVNVPSSSTVASQVRRAQRKGVTVFEVTASQLRDPHDPLPGRMQDLVARWTQRHRIAPMHFLVALESLSFTEDHRYFAATRDDVLVGLLVAIPVPRRNGWMLENLIVEVHAPNGTGESLVDAAMRTFEADGATYATMGLVALAGLDDPPTPAEPDATPLPTSFARLRRGLLIATLRRCYTQLNWFYGFRGLYAFRSRFRPQVWEPIYLAANELITLRTLLAVLLAFMGGRPAVFILKTFDRVLYRLLHPSPREIWAGISAFLSAALVPWIFALLSVDSHYWFDSDWLGKAWASFDVPVALAFGALAVAVNGAYVWARPLARLLLGIVLADCWLTGAQALLYNLPHLRSSTDAVVVAAAVAAPSVAALYLALLIRFVNLEQAKAE